MGSRLKESPKRPPNPCLNSHTVSDRATTQCYYESVSTDATAVIYRTGPHAEPEGCGLSI